MVRKELKPRRLNVCFQTMEFDTISVVDEHVFLLSDGEM
jgi:hypothetical protein